MQRNPDLRLRRDAAKEIFDRAVVARRGLTAEESASYDRASNDISRLDREREPLLSSDAARREVSEINEEYRRARPEPDRLGVR